MRDIEPKEWVVYRTTVGDSGESGPCTICSQAEWMALQSQTNHRHVLVREMIPSEADAERVARSILVPILPKPGKRNVSPPPSTPLPE